MFRWIPFPFIRYCVYLIIGILFYSWFPDIYYSEWIYLIAGLILLYYLLVVFKAKKLIIGIAGLSILFFLGYIISASKDQSRWENHYTIFLNQTIDAFSGKIVSEGLTKEKYSRYTVKLDTIISAKKTQRVSGIFHLYVKNDSTFKPLHYGDYLQISGSITEIPNPMNPAEFNYKKYISRSQIYGQCFVSGNALRIVGNEPENLIVDLAIKVRNIASEMIKKFIKGSREQTIAHALIIGIKDYLDHELKKAYSAAGAMHVLAVSGLHVGIVYGMISYAFGWLSKRKYGMPIYAILLLGGIWFFALVTGLSPSVMRAATMFSIIASRQILNRDSNVYNSLGVTAFFLMLWNPSYIYDVGFQLSFIAVFGIVYFYPIIFRLFPECGWFATKIWSLTSISISAQIATFPLTIYYFHQFPTYFLLSNILVIPATSIILLLSLPMLIIGYFSTDFGLISGYLAEGIIWSLNEVVIWFEALPVSLLDWLQFSDFEVLMIYSILFFFFAVFQYRSFSSFVVFTFCILVFSFTSSFKHQEHISQKKLVIYEIKGKTAIDMINGRSATLYVNDYTDEELELLKFQMDPNRLISGLTSIESNIVKLQTSEIFKSISPLIVFYWEGHRFVIVTNSITSKLFNEKINTDYLILSKNPKIKMEDIKTNFIFNQLIISSDCSEWYSNKIEMEAKKNKIPVHNISKEGFWMLDLS